MRRREVVDQTLRGEVPLLAHKVESRAGGFQTLAHPGAAVVFSQFLLYLFVVLVFEDCVLLFVVS